VHLVMDHVDVVAAQAVRAARASDLIVVDQPVALLDTKGLVLEEALFRSGRPVLVATAKRALPATVKRAMVAWDGSGHAARAVSEAVALFPSLAEIEIVTVTGEKDLSRALPGGDLAHHLARKGIETTLTELTLGHESIGALLDRHADQTGADLLIMGGFGHSRFREFLFGGVTVDLTENATVPLLMAY
jgi:nucleotide-binding universal stress UspA family protein